DTSSLVEYSLPAPTAEPPSALEDRPGTIADPAPAPAAPAVVDVPSIAEVSEPLEAAETAPPAALPTPDIPDAADAAPAPAEPAEAGGGLSDTFMRAVASATDKVGGSEVIEEQPSIIEETP